MIHGYKPLKVADLTNSSLMVLPPVTPSEADIGEWVTLTAYARGDIIRYDKRLYWCVAAGTTGATAPTHTDGDATDGTVTWRFIQPRRKALTFCNTSDVQISLARENAAVDGQGIVLTSLGSTHNEGYGGEQAYQGAWYAIAASGANKTLAVQEG